MHKFLKSIFILVVSIATGAIVDAGAATFLGNLGDRYNRGSLNYAQHKLAHFVVGFCAHELKGEDGLSGGLGAVIGEVVAEHLQREALESTFREAERYGLSDEERLELYLKNIENSEKLGRLAAAGTAFIGRLEITTADSAAQTAIEENSLPHLIAGGAIMSYLAYDYFQVLYTEGWDGLFARIQQEYAESLSVGPNPTVVATAYLAMKWERITARFMASPLGRFVEAKLIKPSNKAFDDFVQFLVSKTPVSHPAFVGASNATTSSKELQQSFTLFSKKLSQNAAKSKTVIPDKVGRFTTVKNGRIGMNVDAVRKHLKDLTNDKNPVLKRVNNEAGIYQVMQDSGCLKKNQYIRLDDAYVQDVTFCPHAHIEVLKTSNPRNRQLLFECIIDENGCFKKKG